MLDNVKCNAHLKAGLIKVMEDLTCGWKVTNNVGYFLGGVLQEVLAGDWDISSGIFGERWFLARATLK